MVELHLGVLLPIWRFLGNNYFYGLSLAKRGMTEGKCGFQFKVEMGNGHSRCPFVRPEVADSISIAKFSDGIGSRAIWSKADRTRELTVPDLIVQ